VARHELFYGVYQSLGIHLMFNPIDVGHVAVHVLYLIGIIHGFYVHGKVFDVCTQGRFFAVYLFFGIDDGLKFFPHQKYNNVSYVGFVDDGKPRRFWTRQIVQGVEYDVSVKRAVFLKLNKEIPHDIPIVGLMQELTHLIKVGCIIHLVVHVIYL